MTYVDRMTRPCDVDRCRVMVTLERIPGGYRVSHGGGEAVTEITWSDLTIEHGYRPWVRTVHEYERGQR